MKTVFDTQYHMVWNNEIPVGNNGFLRVSGLFFPNQLYGIIDIYIRWEIKKNLTEFKFSRVDLVPVKSGDLNDTVHRAQQLWAENQDEYRAKAIELMTNAK